MPPTGPSQPDAPARPTASGEVLLAPQFVRTLAAAVTRLKRFESVEVKAGELVCAARGSDSPAFYKICIEAGRLCISLVMADRYLSQSIEQDLVHNGDKLGDLLADELIDADVRLPVGCPPLMVDHFRDPQKLFTFRTILPELLISPAGLVTAETTAASSPLPHGNTVAKGPVQGGGDEQTAQQLVAILLAYESCFSRLGGMSAGADKD